MPNLIPVIVNAPPEGGSYAPTRPVRAATPQSIGGAFNALAGFVALRSFVWPLQRASGADETSDAGTIETANHRIRWRPASAAKYIRLDIWQLAEVGKGALSIEARLYRQEDGEAVELADGPVTWSTANNYLGVSADDLVFEGDPNEVDGVYVVGSRDRWVETGWIPVAAGALPTTPRPLVIPDSDDVLPPMLELELDVDGVRLYSVTVQEMGIQAPPGGA